MTEPREVSLFIIKKQVADLLTGSLSPSCSSTLLQMGQSAEWSGFYPLSFWVTNTIPPPLLLTFFLQWHISKTVFQRLRRHYRENFWTWHKMTGPTCSTGKSVVCGAVGQWALAVEADYHFTHKKMFVYHNKSIGFLATVVILLKSKKAVCVFSSSKWKDFPLDL